MKKCLLFLVILTYSCTFSDEKSSQEIQIRNLSAFAEIYGYVKYFHPSDEANEIDWDSFAVFASNEVLKCNSEKELLQTLKSLFKPIAPTISITSINNSKEYLSERLIPPNKDKFKLTFWQHKGPYKDTKTNNRNEGVYESSRVNGVSYRDSSDTFGMFMSSFDLLKHIGKELKFSGRLKLGENSNGSGHLRLQVLDKDGTTLTLDNMRNNPAKSNNWEDYSLVTKIDTNANVMKLGFSLKGKGILFFDTPKISYRKENEWIEIPWVKDDFRDLELDTWNHTGIGYKSKILNQDLSKVRKIAKINYVGATRKIIGRKIFDFQPKFDKIISVHLEGDISCQIPITLYTNESHTYPMGERISLDSLISKLKFVEVKENTLALRVSNTIILYNVLKHFYPYFEEVNVDWEKAFKESLERCFIDKTKEDHLISLQKFTAVLKDGHISVSRGSYSSYGPPIAWDWVQNQLIITKVLESDLKLKVGDRVTQINNIDANDYFEEIYSRISSGTSGWLNYRAKFLSLEGKEGSDIILTINDEKLKLPRNSLIYEEPARQSSYEKINDSVFYLNLTKSDMITINELIPKLTKMKSIICDLRGYPNQNHEFLTHLLSVKDTAMAYFKVAKIVYPNQKNIVGYKNYQWKLRKKKPYLGDKQIIFITDGRAISYAEGILAYVKGYNLGTIIGQATAGANGNMNAIFLPGGYEVTWTGMKTVKLDGTRLHGIGIIPDIELKRTIEGVIREQDEFLEYAIKLTEKRRLN